MNKSNKSNSMICDKSTLLSFRSLYSLLIAFYAASSPILLKAQDVGTNEQTATAASTLSDDEKLAWNTLLLIADDMQNGATDDVKKNACSEFLDKSTTFATAHPENLKVWVFRAQAALTLDDFEHGIDAGSKLKALGAIKSDDLDIIKLMASLNRKGWLDFENKQQAVEQGVVLYNQAKADYDGNGVSQDFDLAMKYFKKGADLGNTDCMYYIGQMFWAGQSVAADRTEAYKWFHEAATAGDTNHLGSIGLYCIMQSNPSEAMQWLSKGANIGDTNCMSYLGDIYSGSMKTTDGTILPRDYDTAMSWYKKLQDLGFDETERIDGANWRRQHPGM